MVSATEYTPAMLNDLKIANRRTVLAAFRRGVTAGAGDISQQTGISRPTVVKCIRFFQESGLLVSLGKGKSTATGGKRPENYALSEQRYFVCLALWPMQLRAHLYTIGHTMLGSLVVSAPLPQDPQEAGQAAARITEDLLSRYNVKLEEVCAVSVSTSGIVDRATGTLMFSAQTPEWGYRVHLLDPLNALFRNGTPVFLENAAKMCARPFLLDPSLRTKRVLVLFTTWGVSACLMDRGHIENGRNSLIGEIGHMTIDPDDPEPCGCGSHGCFERLISPARVRQLAVELASGFPHSPLADDDSFTIPQMFLASAAGDPLAQEISRRLAGRFAHVLRNVSVVFDPDCVILQGDFAHADDCFREALSHEMRDFRYFPGGTPFELRGDTRSIGEMDAEGAFIALDHLYFSNPDLYRDESPET